MKRFRYIILFSLLPLHLCAEEFIVHQIQSNNALLQIIAESIIKRKVENTITISVEGDIAYISYDSSRKSIEFHKVPEGKGNFYFKTRKSHTAKLFMDDLSSTDEVYFILEKNGKRKMKVSLMRV